jgi:hypothetical protein
MKTLFRPTLLACRIVSVAAVALFAQPVSAQHAVGDVVGAFDEAAGLERFRKACPVCGSVPCRCAKSLNPTFVLVAADCGAMRCDRYDIDWSLTAEDCVGIKMLAERSRGWSAVWCKPE